MKDFTKSTNQSILNEELFMTLLGVKNLNYFIVHLHRDL
jgi:hypothetical protein